MSVYLPRSAVSPTISGRARPRATSASPNGASTDARPPSAASSSPMASVRARSAIGGNPFLEFADERIPFAWARRGRNAPSRAARASPRPCRGASGARSPWACRCRRARREAPQRRRTCRCRRSPCVSKPKARHFSAIGSMSRTRLPSAWMPLQSIRATSRSRPKWAADMAASQVAPSCISPSESSTKTRAGRAVEAEAERLADALAESVAERAADHLDAGRRIERAHVEPAVVGAVGRELRERDDPAFGERRPERDRVVPGREQEAVAIRPGEIRRDRSGARGNRARREGRRCRGPGRYSPALVRGPCGACGGEGSPHELSAHGGRDCRRGNCCAPMG